MSLSKLSEKVLTTQEIALKKCKKALDRVNNAYEMGDYSRYQWLQRKEKWQKSIEELQCEIFALKSQYSLSEKITNEERKQNLSSFLDHITKTTENSERNDLYRTIINGIIYLRVSDTIEVKIDFR